MTKKTIIESMKEAQEFIKRAKECLKELEEDKHDSYIGGTGKSGALRRQSMELSRSLTELRR